MSRFLLSAMPFTGHVTPMVALAGELVERGHEVRVYTGSRFRRSVQSVGAKLVPWEHAPDFDENNLVDTFPRLSGKPGVRQMFANVVDCFVATAPAQMRDLQAEWEGCHGTLSSPMKHRSAPSFSTNGRGARGARSLFFRSTCPDQMVLPVVWVSCQEQRQSLGRAIERCEWSSR